MAQQVAYYRLFFLVFNPTQMDPYGSLHIQWFAFQEKNFELREHESCKLGSMPTFCSGEKYYLKNGLLY